MANYDINYDDERFTQVEQDKQQALSEVEKTYGGMISESDKYYQAQIDASKQWADKQQQLQQENTDFAIEKIEQQKEQANKDYLKEQSGAYVDWQKQSNKYGANAEQMASGGMMGTGFSESSRVGMYNAYQSRVATARESYNNAVMNYNNAIKEAQLQNNSILAEIAYQSLQQELELALQGFQYKNQLVLDQANKKLEVDNMYYSRYQDVLNQMNTENALAEQVRQYNENMQLQKEQLNESIRQFEQNFSLQQKEFDEKVRQYEQNYQLEIKQFNESIRQFDEEIARLKKKDEQEYKLQIQNLNLQKQQLQQQKLEAERNYKLQQQELAQQQAQFDKEYKLKQQQLSEEKRQFNASLSASNSSGGSGGDAKINNDKAIDDSKKYAVNTDYYKGDLNSDANKFGTFSNEYQPKGISGHGAVSKSGATYTFTTPRLNGTKQIVTQNVWKAEDGTYWYWYGYQNKYVQLKYNSKKGTFSKA